MQDTIGIDISKDTLDIHRQSDGRHARFGNDKAGLAALRRWIGKAPVRVVYEATGRYHRDMEAALDAAGHALVKVNPGRARRFAQAAGYGPRPIVSMPPCSPGWGRCSTSRPPRFAARPCTKSGSCTLRVSV